MSSLYERLKKKEATSGGGPPRRESAPETASTASSRPRVVRAQERPRPDDHRALKNRVQEKLVSVIEEDLFTGGRALTSQEKVKVRRRISEILAEEEDLSPLEQERIEDELMAEIIGYGPIQPLLDDPEVDEIMVNSPSEVYVERKGRIHRSDVRFTDEKQIMHLIEKIVTPLGRRIDEANPMVDARLPDGSRVNAIIPPLAVRSPIVTVRKFSTEPLTVDDLIELGTITERMAVFLEACVRARLNVIVSGGTGSGKTTTLNVLSSFIPDDERIITIEDAAELQLRQEHVVSLETRPPNVEGRGEIDIRQLVRNSLRMRPDRIVVGEVRSGEALDMLQAMNTGHDGSLTTAHANSPRDLLSRLETMVLMAGMELPVKAIREQIASALNIVVHQARLRDGSRRVTHLTEVAGMEGDVVLLQDLFLFRVSRVTPDGKVIGGIQATGIRPSFSDRLFAAGVGLPDDLFEREGEAVAG